MNASLEGHRAGRVLEPEVMDDDLEVAAYTDAQGQAHLSSLDDSFVRSVLRLGVDRGRALDVGTGAGEIPIKIAARRPRLRITGIDLSPAMLKAARHRAREASVRVAFRRANARRLPFEDHSLDLVISNSLLHHLPDPVPVLDEMARLLKPGGALFVRDLRRPRADRIAAHIRVHGRHYRGLMLKLFGDSVRAAYTLAEIRSAVARSRLGGVKVRRQMETYFVIERKAR